MIRLDMSEYMEKHSVSKLIGAPPGYAGFDESGTLTDKIRRKPYCVLLFDEIEKAHPDVFNILLQVLDDGHITDSKGRKVSFKNAIIIMTSNAGASRIVDPKNLGFATKTTEQQDYQRMKNGVMEEVKRLFKPEFINRVDDIIVFRKLNKEDLLAIIDIELGKLGFDLRANGQRPDTVDRIEFRAHHIFVNIGKIHNGLHGQEVKIAEELTFLVSHVQETRGIAFVEPLLHPLGHLELGHVRLLSLIHISEPTRP